MKKLLNFIILLGISLLFVSCESKNSIPKELLGMYVQDGIEAYHNGKENILDYYKHDGTAKLERKGNRYYLEINTKYIIDKEVVRTFDLKASGKVKEIKYQEFPNVLSVVGKYSKDIYYVTFTDVEVSGKDGDTFKYSPEIILVKERKLKTKEEDISDYLSFFSTLQPEKSPVSILWIDGTEFKKNKEITLIKLIWEGTMLSTFMIIVRYTLLFIAIKYGKTLLRMINQEYERKFNYKFTSKKNIIRPFLASIFITIGFYTSLFSYSECTLLLTGIGLIAYEVYDVYKKTDLKYAMISAFIYLFMVIFFLCLGLFILCIFIFMAVAYEYKHKKEEIYIYRNNDFDL